MKKVFLKGPLLTQSGYGHHARTVLRALQTRPDVFDIYLQPIPWGQTSWVWQNSEERKEIDRLLNKTIHYINSDGKFDVSKMRYHKIIIMTDADIDGSHIRTLVLTFFFRYMRPLIENNYLYIALPPLYLLAKGKDKRYVWSESEKDKTIKDMSGNGKEDSVSIQRYKGLGEMNSEQLWTTTMDPENRSLNLVTIESAAEADRIFSQLMGDDVVPRREFIERNALNANVDA